MSDDYSTVFTNLNFADAAAEKLKDPVLNWLGMAASGMEVADLALTEAIKHLSGLQQDAVTAKSDEGVAIFQIIIDHGHGFEVAAQ